MRMRSFGLGMALVLAVLVVCTGCEALLASGPSITKFQHEDYSYGTTHDVTGGDTLTFVVDGEMPGGLGTLEVIADKDGSETLLLEKEIATEDIAITDLRVPFSLSEEGTYEVFARATTADTAKIGESSRIKFNVSVTTVEGVYIEKYAVARLDNEVSLYTRTLPIGAPAEDVTFTSSDPAIVSVSGGTLTAVGGGIATITATTVDTGHTAEAQVYVPDEDASSTKSGNPDIWDVNASDTTKHQDYDYDRYYVVAVTGSALYLSLTTDDFEYWIEYEVRNGTEWSSGTTLGDDNLENNTGTTIIAEDLDPGFYMLELAKGWGGENVKVDVNVWGN